jgi:hypothetical protein
MDEPDVIYTGTQYLETYDDAYAFATYELERQHESDVKYLLATPERELAGRAFKLLRFIQDKIKSGDIAEDLKIEESLDLMLREADGQEFYI